MNVIKRIKNYIEDKQFEKEMVYYDNYFINEYETIDKKYIWVLFLMMMLLVVHKLTSIL